MQKNEKPNLLILPLKKFGSDCNRTITKPQVKRYYFWTL